MKKEALKLGLYGCGARTQALVDSVIGEGIIKVVCCYDIDKKRRDEVAKKYSTSSVDSPQKLIENQDVEAFLISLPPKLHAEVAMEVAEAGKPIFLEKPIATNLEDGKKLVKKIKGKNIVCRVGLAYRYVPVFKKVTELVKSGQTGKIIGIQYDWIGWIGILYKQIYDGKNWRGDPETGGQIIYHMCHLFDILRVWSGEIVSVFADSNHLIFPGSTTDNETFIILKHEGGAISGIHFSEVSKHCTGLGRIDGEKITVEFEWQDKSWIKIYRQARRVGDRSPDEIIDDIKPDVMDSEIMKDFVKEARREKEAGVNIEDGFVPLKVAFAIKESIIQERKIYLKEL